MNLLLDLDPKDETLKIVDTSVNAYPIIIQIFHESLQIGLIILRSSGNCQKGSDESFLNVSEAEVIGNIRNCLAKLIREVNVLVVLEFSLPEMTICDTLLDIRIGEEILPIKARRTFLRA